MPEKEPTIIGLEVASSPSEDRGIELLSSGDLRVYSAGISTGGVAEIRMARGNPKRHIVATTIDADGLEFAQRCIAQNHVQDQIDAKLEDIAQPLPHPDNFFDYVYARLVLHYLPKDDLVASLAELHRIVRPGGRLFVVVRSTESHDMKREGVVTDPKTMLSTFTFRNKSTGREQTFSRYFHSEASIRDYVQQAGFEVNDVQSRTEQIYVDFMRTQLASEPDTVIELLATKRG